LNSPVNPLPAELRQDGASQRIDGTGGTERKTGIEIGNSRDEKITTFRAIFKFSAIKSGQCGRELASFVQGLSKFGVAGKEQWKRDSAAGSRENRVVPRQTRRDCAGAQGLP
jgi:hypothetical protein